MDTLCRPLGLKLNKFNLLEFALLGFSICLPTCALAAEASGSPSGPSPDLLASSSANSLCISARLSSLRAEDVKGLDEEANFCGIQDLTQVPKPIKAAIQKMGELNEKAAKYLNLDPQKLLPQGISVRLTGSNLGPLGSQANQEVLMGVFPDWLTTVRDSESPINDALYLHELGHALTALPNPLLPGSGTDLQKSAFLSEALADLLAIGITGTTISPQSDLPEQITNLRKVLPNQSYLNRKEYFDVLYADRKIEEACLDLRANDALNTPHGRVFCGQAMLKDIPLIKRQQGLDPEKSFSDLGSGLSGLLGLKTNLFDPHDVSAQRRAGKRAYDSHQLGVPINSFLIDLGTKIGKPAQRMFLASIAQVVKEEIKLQVSCTLQRPGASKAEIQDNAIVGSKTSFSSIVGQMSAMLEPKELAIASALFAVHGMPDAVAMADDEALDSVLRSTRLLVTQKIEGEKSGFFADSKECLSILKAGDYPPTTGACSIQCELAGNKTWKNFQIAGQAVGTSLLDRLRSR